MTPTAARPRSAVLAVEASAPPVVAEVDAPGADLREGVCQSGTEVG